MKVLLVSPLPPPVGGIATVTASIIRYIKTNVNGINLILCNSAYKPRPRVIHPVIYNFLTKFSNSTRIYFDVREIIKKEKPKLVHLSSSSSFALIKDWLIISFTRRFRIPVIMHWHFGRIPVLAKKNNLEWKLLCHVIQKSTWSIVIDSKSHKTLYGLGFRNIFNIPNPLALDVEQKARDSVIRSTYKRQQGRIIFAGNILREKGVYELVHACTLVPSIKELIFIGPYKESVKKELLKSAQKRDNGIWLQFMGTFDNDYVLELMQTSPILALPSYTEGFPMVVIEAMAMGCAVIATDAGAIPEILAISTTAPCGICVPVQNVEKLREAVSTLVENPSKSEMMGKNGIARVLDNYTIEKIFSQYEKVWEAAVNW